MLVVHLSVVAEAQYTLERAPRTSSTNGVDWSKAGGSSSIFSPRNKTCFHLIKTYNLCIYIVKICVKSEHDKKDSACDFWTLMNTNKMWYQLTSLCVININLVVIVWIQSQWQMYQLPTCIYSGITYRISWSKTYVIHEAESSGVIYCILPKPSRMCAHGYYNVELEEIFHHFS